MSGWNGSGTFNRVYSWVADALAGIDITASRMDTDTNNITSNGFGNTLTRDGQGSATANLPMNGFKHTNVANGVAATDYAAFGQLNNNEGVVGGRLTLITATPVLTANETAQTTIFYTPYLHDFISIYNGTNWAMYQFIEQSVNLDATNFVSGSLYDLFIFLSGTTPLLGYGPAWTNSTTRSAAIARLNGVWTNSGTITLRENSSTTVSVSANQATYVGTAYATANGQTGMNFIPAAASTGSNNILGLYNAYNRVPINALCRTSTTNWSYNTNTWRASDNSANMRVSYVDGLGTIGARVLFSSAIGSSGTGAIGVGFNSTSTAPTHSSAVFSAANQTQLNVTEVFLPAVGFNFVTGMEVGDGATATTYRGQDTINALTIFDTNLQAWLDM